MYKNKHTHIITSRPYYKYDHKIHEVKKYEKDNKNNNRN